MIRRDLRILMMMAINDHDPEKEMINVLKILKLMLIIILCWFLGLLARSEAEAECNRKKGFLILEKKMFVKIAVAIPSKSPSLY